MMSNKQDIYRELIRQSIILSRSTLSSKIVYGKNRRAAYELAELTHNLWVTLFEEDFCPHDFHILNYQAKSFCERAVGTGIYEPIKALIAELFSEVPEEQRYKLEWSGP